MRPSPAEIVRTLVAGPLPPLDHLARHPRPPHDPVPRAGWHGAHPPRQDAT